MPLKSSFWASLLYLKADLKFLGQVIRVQNKMLFYCLALHLGSCPLNAAACLVDGSSYINIGEVAEGPRWENGITVLKYVNGDKCPDKIRKKMTILRLKCDESKVVSILVGMRSYLAVILALLRREKWSTF